MANTPNSIYSGVGTGPGDILCKWPTLYQFMMNQSMDNLFNLN